jgi:hypothetical protein
LLPARRDSSFAVQRQHLNDRDHEMGLVREADSTALRERDARRRAAAEDQRSAGGSADNVRGMPHSVAQRFWRRAHGRGRSVHV